MKGMLRELLIIILALLSFLCFIAAAIMIKEAGDRTSSIIVFFVVPIIIFGIATSRKSPLPISTILIRAMTMWVCFVVTAWVTIGTYRNVTNVTRYLITVTVETPEGIKRGSAVREATWSGMARFDGEAVAVDLGSRGILFALPDDTSGYGISSLTVMDFPLRQKPEVGTTYSVPLDQYPDFIKFDDLNDPASAKKVLTNNSKGMRGRRKTVLIDDLEEAFGKDVSIQKITLQITTDPVTRDLEKWIPWLPCVAQMDGKTKRIFFRHRLFGIKTREILAKQNKDCTAYWQDQPKPSAPAPQQAEPAKAE